MQHNVGCLHANSDSLLVVTNVPLAHARVPTLGVLLLKDNEGRVRELPLICVSYILLACLALQTQQCGR